MRRDDPIGIFDSGVGGLTVTSEVMKRLPGEDIIYFGDTGRYPYGSRSPKIVEKFALQDAYVVMMVLYASRMLLQKENVQLDVNLKIHVFFLESEQQ